MKGSVAISATVVMKPIAAMNKALIVLAVAAMAMAMATATTPCRAQTQPAYPSHAIRIVVPSAPGGTADSYARILGKAAGEILGQTFVIENTPGAASVIGTE